MMPTARAGKFHETRSPTFTDNPPIDRKNSGFV